MAVYSPEVPPIPERILLIKRRADRLNVSMAKLCQLAETNTSSVNRWLIGGRDVHYGNFSRVCGRLEAALDKIESQLFASLAPKFLPAEILAKLDLTEKQMEAAE